jgi:hypothetical protein
MTSISFTAYPRNSVTRLCFCFYRNSEIDGRRELSDVLNWRRICFEDFEIRPTS